MRPAVFAAIAIVLELALSGKAYAENGLRPAAAEPLRTACTADYFRWCRGTPPGGGRILLCLNAHADKLSEPCFQALAERGLAFAAALKACGPDYERLCAGVPPGMGRGLACLMANLAALSPACHRALTEEDRLGLPPGTVPGWQRFRRRFPQPGP